VIAAPVPGPTPDTTAIGAPITSGMLPGAPVGADALTGHPSGIVTYQKGDGVGHLPLDAPPYAALNTLSGGPRSLIAATRRASTGATRRGRP